MAITTVKFIIGDIPFSYPACIPLKDKAVFNASHGDKEVSGNPKGTHSNLHKERAKNVHEALCLKIEGFQAKEKAEKEAITAKNKAEKEAKKEEKANKK